VIGHSAQLRWRWRRAVDGVKPRTVKEWLTMTMLLRELLTPTTACLVPGHNSFDD
jgi:hypothetical protein